MSTPPKGGFWRTLATIAATIGLGVVGIYALDPHAHTCGKCGRTWRHLGVLKAGDVAAHTCPGCGTVQTWRDAGAGADGAIAVPGALATRTPLSALPVAALPPRKLLSP